MAYGNCELFQGMVFDNAAYGRGNITKKYMLYGLIDEIFGLIVWPLHLIFKS